MSNAGVLTRLNGTIYNQFGKDVLVTQIRFGTLEAIFEIDHEVQRQLDPARRAEIRNFIKGFGSISLLILKRIRRTYRRLWRILRRQTLMKGSLHICRLSMERKE